MQSLLLSGLEKTLNKVLQLDPASRERIAKLQGKSIKLEISDWNFACYFLPYQSGVQIVKEYDKEPDTMIRGKLFNLIRAGAGKASTRALFNEGITISGDTRTGEAFRDVLKELDIDWEEQLSAVLGNRIAPPLTHQFKKFLKASKESLRSLRGNISEYLHYESQQLPPKQAVETFMAEVDLLRNDVDRLEARINRLNHRKQTT